MTINTKIIKHLENLPDWQIDGDQIKAEFSFSDFAEAMKFVNAVALEAEKMNHHPEWSNIYNQVSIKLSTHDAGDKVTDLDIELATKISACAKKFSK